MIVRVSNWREAFNTMTLFGWTSWTEAGWWGAANDPAIDCIPEGK